MSVDEVMLGLRSMDPAISVCLVLLVLVLILLICLMVVCVRNKKVCRDIADCVAQASEESVAGFQKIDARLEAGATEARMADGMTMQHLAGIKATAESIATSTADLGRQVRADMQSTRGEVDKKLEEIRHTVDDRLSKTLANQTNALNSALERQSRSIEANTQASTQGLQHVSEVVERQLGSMRDDNAKKLDLMRQTVDEKLQKTLDERMTQSFQQVSTQLEQVYRGLGEMRGLAEGVGDLKRVLSNVKTRGILGEIQLGAILKEILAPEQYAENVVTVPGSSNRVEYAVRLPGEEGDAIWLPIDSKFPADAYEHLREATDHADRSQIDEAWRQLEARLKSEARDIRDKYVAPPNTTNFGIMFLPFEGLYAEVVSRPGLIESLQHEYKVNVCGPSTMAALLNSLQMGFQTVAIQRHTDEIATILRAVEVQIEKYQDYLVKAQKQIRRADSTLDSLITTRTSAIKRKLKSVSSLELPASSEEVLGIEDNSGFFDDESIHEEAER